jgi:uncharacterized damage-inducible protein DinB
VIDARYSLTPESTERELLATFLEFQRDALARKCAGLSDEQMCRRAIPTSNISLVGLVRHLATVERWYFQSVIAGGSPGELYDYESDEAFNDVDGASGEESLRIWADEVTASRAIAAAHELDAVSAIPTEGLVVTLRWVLVHMIDEYARHLGHADIVREAIDGVTGE